MPQWRKLHAKVVESIDVNEMPDDFTRLLWVLLPTQLCCQGRGQDYPAWIRARVFPLRQDVTLDMVEAAMTWYAGRGMLLRYQVAGRPYFQLANWSRYQGNTSREAPSDYPPPDSSLVEGPAEPPGQAPPSSAAAQGECVPDSSTAHEPLSQHAPRVRDKREEECVSDSRPDADAETDAETDAEGESGATAPVPSPAEGPVPSSVERLRGVPGGAEGLRGVPGGAEGPAPARKPKSPPAACPEPGEGSRRAAHRYPPKSWYADVDSAVGREGPDLQFWEQVVKEWVGHGWNPTNVSGMLDCYNSRQLPGRGPRAAGPPADPIQAAIQAIEEEGWT